MTQSDEELRQRYGADAVISRSGRFVLVHLDRPDAALICRRTREFDPKDYFEDDCPLCAIQRASGVYVFDEFPEEEEEVLIE